MGMMVRPHIAYLRFRERRRARSAKIVRSDISLDSLPQVTLVPAAGREDLQKKLLKLFKWNPAPYDLAPRNRRSFMRELSRGTQYFMIHNDRDELVGGLAYQTWRNMPCQLVIDYRHRSMGYGISAMKEIERVKTREGVTELWGQVIKSNKRMLSLMLSLGYRYVDEQEAPQYFTFVKKIASDDEDH